MTSVGVLDWITERYGTPQTTQAGGVYVAVVALYQGVAIGVGSDMQGAVWDLYLDLSHDGRRPDVPDPRQPWEVARRDERARARQGG